MIKKIIENQYFKYIVAGGITTLISIISFYYLINKDIDYKIATILSFIISASFAFISNKMYVFKYRNNSVKEIINSYMAFISSRLFTLGIDFFGMILLVKYIKLDALYSKILLNVIIFILNYLISKFIIFKEKREKVI